MMDIFEFVNTDLTEDFDEMFYLVLYKYFEDFALKKAVV